MPNGTHQAWPIVRRWQSGVSRVAPYAAAASAALVLWHAANDPSGTEPGAPAPLVYQDTAARLRPASGAESVIVATQQASVAATTEIVVGRHDTLDAIFRRLALDTGDLAAIRNLPGIRQSIDYLKPGEAIKVTHAAGAVRELSRRLSTTQTLTVVRGDAGFAARMVSNPLETRVRTASATIESSLFQAAESAKVPDAVALQLANVFAWDIDFVLDIRDGDHFTVVYQQIFEDGRFLHDGAVLAAEFVNDGKRYRAVRFIDQAGRAGYYTPEGKPMRKAFLRAPLAFTRVSSGFNPHRRHPILNTIRGHLGTDYSAPVGTPVYAAGDGRVAFEGRKGGYGNAIVLAHNNGVSTLYGHLSRFARDLRPGSKVRQGELIGYVGMTGLATGPHLHYEYLMNGVHKNPQTVQLPGAEPLSAAVLEEFRRAAAPLVADLAAPSRPAGDAPAARASALPLAQIVPIASTPAPPTPADKGG